MTAVSSSAPLSSVAAYPKVLLDEYSNNAFSLMTLDSVKENSMRPLRSDPPQPPWEGNVEINVLQAKCRSLEVVCFIHHAEEEL